MLVFTIIHSAATLWAEASRWLFGTAVALFALSAALAVRRRLPAMLRAAAASLRPVHRAFLAAALVAALLVGAPKDGGDPDRILSGGAAPPVPLRALPVEFESPSNRLAIAAFAVDVPGRTLGFSVRWPTNLFDYTDSRNVFLLSSTDITERIWAPLGLYPMPEGTNAHSFEVSAYDVEPEMRRHFLDSLGGVGFYRLGLDFDSDSDGIADVIERFWTRTDPLAADTDLDGIADGEELFGEDRTDPLVYDTDGDGAGDGDEALAGTNPLLWDTDMDGVTDGAELGSVEALDGDGFMWADFSSATDLVTGQASDYGEWEVTLPRQPTINGVVYSHALVQTDGTVHLLCPTNEEGRATSCKLGSLANTSYSDSHVTIALFGADLYADPANWQSRIRYGTGSSEGSLYSVVEYRDIGLWNNRGTSERMTCQLLIPFHGANTLYVSYLCASNAFREVEARVGVQCGGLPSRKTGEQFHNLSWRQGAGFPEEGLTIRYKIGSGTDPLSGDTDGDGLADFSEAVTGSSPLLADTDGDGICDPQEPLFALNPVSADTDGDGMPDGWEVANGLNALHDDSAYDADSDGLSNIEEFTAGTDPNSADTDSDGLSDFAETVYGSDPLLTDTDGDGLGDAQEAAIGTNPSLPDTDGDGLPDFWESIHGLDPLSDSGGDGPDGDPDLDGLSNARELELGTGPTFSDSDLDGLPDGRETGLIVVTNALPWLAFDQFEDLTATIQTAARRSVGRATPAAWKIQGESVTNVTVCASGVVFLDRAGRANPGCQATGHSFSAPLDADALVVAPFMQDTHFRSDIPGRETAIRLGTATHGGEGYLLVEFANAFRDNVAAVTNAISFQVAIPTNRPDRANVLYRDLLSQNMTGGGASVGMQTFGGRWLHRFCHREAGRVAEGMGLAFLFGENTDPLEHDTDGDRIGDGDEADVYGSDPLDRDMDGDGLLDGVERLLGLDMFNPDTDGDGLPDGWEARRQLDPLSAAGDDGANGDPDGDGLTNLQEFAAGSDPLSGDTDGDGLGDAQELLRGTDPNAADTDLDGLSDALEVSLGTNPLQPDTDGDGMNDGWEHLHAADGFDPAIDNALDSNPDNDICADPDGDGLTNGDECVWETHPGSADTDGDGVGDGAEVNGNSDPVDPGDDGEPDSRVPVPLRFGDPSGSHSEKYRLEVTPVGGEGDEPTSYSWLNEQYGVCETKTAMLKPGWKYEVRLRHAGTNGDGAGYPDYDYELCFGGGSPEMEGVIKVDADGLFGTDSTSDHFAGEGKVACLYAIRQPLLVPDYNRDGSIGAADRALAAQGKTLRFWVNDDRDRDASGDGDIAKSGDDDIPSAAASGRDCHDGRVNGRRDLVDFTPVFLFARDVSSLPEDIRNGITFRLRHDSGAANVVWSGLSPSDAGLFQRAPVCVCGPSLDEKSFRAETARVTSGAGLAVPEALAARMRQDAAGKGVVLLEGRSTTAAPLKLEVRYGTRSIATCELPMQLSSVEDMYRWINSRGLSDEAVTCPSRLGEPPNRPDDETSGRHLVFLHGVNVTQERARGWAAEVFKRMWQSGLTAKFTGVTWRSDIGTDANYQENVSNAFFTASAIAQSVAALPGTKVLMAHSLGNVVCSAMVQDYGLSPACYLMCNSAVPAEAYDTDASLHAPQLVHAEWEDYPPASWAANWHGHFADFPNDDRRHLGWPGRFADVASIAVNFYSTGDQVLELAKNNNVGLFTGVDGLSTKDHHSWHKQELFKGRAYLPGGTKWSGWGFAKKSIWYGGGHKVSAAEAQNMTSADFRTNTVFNCYPESMNSPTIPRLVIDAHLAQGIPAMTPATGSVSVDSKFPKGRRFNLDLRDGDEGILLPNDWPKRKPYSNRWCHSDLKDVAFFFVFPFYDKAIEKGGLK